MASPIRTPSQERWLNFFNHVLYNSAAPVYAAMDWLTLGVWWRLVRRALDYVPNQQSVLEIAVGPGKLQAALARIANRCYGLDMSARMCALTQHRLRRAGLTGYLAQGDALALPYRANTFDVVVSTFAFSGFPSGPGAMHEMARITREGGRVVLVDIGLPSDHNPIGTFLAHLWERMGDCILDQRALMESAGLKNTTLVEYGPGRHIRVVVGIKPLSMKMSTPV